MVDGRWSMVDGRTVHLASASMGKWLTKRQLVAHTAPSAIGHRPSTIGHRPSTIDHRPSTID